MMPGRVALTIALITFATIGCSADLSGTLGQLGEGVFRYNCVETSDARCNDSESVSSFDTAASLGVDPELPEGIAVGARFDLTYVGDTIDDGEVIIVDVEPARPDLVTHAAGFVMEVPGTFAFLARNAPKQRVVDFIHVEALDVAGIDVWSEQLQTTAANLRVGEARVMAAVPVSDAGIPLAGALPMMWESSDASVASISQIGGAADSGEQQINVDEIEIVGVAAGTATITVTQGDFTRTVDVTVEPEMMP